MGLSLSRFWEASYAGLGGSVNCVWSELSMVFPLSFTSKELAESHLGSKQARLIFQSLCFGVGVWPRYGK